jgi:opacity protein-like surface antigen
MKSLLFVAVLAAAALGVVAATASASNHHQAANKLTVWLQVDAQNGWPDLVAAANSKFEAANPGPDGTGLPSRWIPVKTGGKLRVAVALPPLWPCFWRPGREVINGITTPVGNKGWEIISPRRLGVPGPHERAPAAESPYCVRVILRTNGQHEGYVGGSVAWAY